MRWIAVVGIISLCGAGEVTAGDWNQWRGPERTGVASADAVWPDQLSTENLKQLWHVSLGSSYSGPIVVGDKVISTESTNDQEIVRAFHRATGEPLWESKWIGAMKVPFFAAANGSWIRATPASDGELLFVAGMRDVLVCLEVATGREKWRFDFVDAFKSPLPSFGFVCSPLIDGDFVYVQAGGGLVKLNKKTGLVSWRVLDDGGGMNGSAFSSPLFAELQGVRQLLVQTREKLCGVEPSTGAVLWEMEIPAFRGMNIITPVVHQGRILTSTYGGASLLLEPRESGGKWTVETLWENKLQGYMSTPVVHDHFAYLHLRNQRFACLDLETGKEAWITTPFGKYWSLVRQGDRLLTLDERGDLRLIRANPLKYEQLGEVHLTDDPTWAHLAITDNQIFVRELNGLTVYQWQ